MINIHKQLWVVKGVDRKVEDSEHLLAYMTHQEYTKDNTETKAFSNRKETGKKWARVIKREWIPEDNRHEVHGIIEGEEVQFDNTPTPGFRIVGSVSRWSTDNKLIQIEDPRGFVVEIPTSNLTTLLKNTTVTKGEVMEQCVWGRYGSNHILLPINSDVYLKAFEDNVQKASEVSFNKLKVGQVVKFGVGDPNEYVYVGRGKATWEIQTKKSTKLVISTWRNSHLYDRDDLDEVIDTSYIEDDQKAFIFQGKDNLAESKNIAFGNTGEYRYTGKCIVIRESDTPVTEDIWFNVSIPSRLCKESQDYYSNYSPTYTRVTTVSFAFQKLPL